MKLRPRAHEERAWSFANTIEASIFQEFSSIYETGGSAVAINGISREPVRGTQSQFSENICSEDDLTSRILGTFVVKFRACLPLLGFSNI